MSLLIKVLDRAGFIGPHSPGPICNIKKAMNDLGLKWEAGQFTASMARMRISPDTAVTVTVLHAMNRAAGEIHPETALFVFAIDGDEFAVHPLNAMWASPTSEVPLYGRISDQRNGLVGGGSPQTIVCKGSGGLREVCVFNRYSGIWSAADEAELQVVLKALQMSKSNQTQETA